MFFTNSLKAANIDGLMCVDEDLDEIIYDFEKTDLSLIKKVFYDAIDKVNALNNKFIRYKGFDFFSDGKTYKPCKDVETIDELGNKYSSFFNIITKKKQNLNHILQENISVKNYFATSISLSKAATSSLT